MNQYFVGNFDGTSFTADDGVARLMDFGKDFYAVQTYNNTPSGDAIAVGWLSNWQYSASGANLSVARGIHRAANLVVTAKPHPNWSSASPGTDFARGRLHQKTLNYNGSTMVSPGSPLNNLFAG